MSTRRGRPERSRSSHASWRCTSVGDCWGLVVVLASWLACAPFLWRYDGLAPGFDARVNDLVVAALLGAFGIAWSGGLLPRAAVRFAGAATGGWLLVAPLVLDYGVVTDSIKASVNDVLVGAAVVTLSLVTTREVDRQVG